MQALILEDNRDRRVAMIARLAERFPFVRTTFFEASLDMIEYMQSKPLEDVALISLDHDLEMIPTPQGELRDPGTGLDIAQWLSKLSQPVCPVVVQTTNSRAGDKMMEVLQAAGWHPSRVVPHDDLRWVDSDWFPAARNAIVGFAPRAIDGGCEQQSSSATL